MRVEVKYKNLTKTTAFMREKLPNKLPTSSTTSSKKPKFTPNVAYEDDEYKPLRVEEDPIHEVSSSYNT